jgi:23S rRNA pseudouridine2605 synthase
MPDGDSDTGDTGDSHTGESRQAPSAGDSEGGGQRLQKVLARVGLGSRRACEELIADGRVVVNGERAVLGQRVDPTRDRVELDGVALPLLPGLVHYVLNKPAGVLTTADPPWWPSSPTSRVSSPSAGSMPTARDC